MANTTPQINPEKKKKKPNIVTEQFEADGEAGAVLITNLNGNGVAGVEYATIGRALAQDSFRRQVPARLHDPGINPAINHPVTVAEL